MAQQSPSEECPNQRLEKLSEEFQHISRLLKQHVGDKPVPDRSALKTELWIAFPWTTPKVLFAMNVDRVLDGVFQEGQTYGDRYYARFLNQFPAVPIYETERGKHIVGSFVSNVIPHKSQLAKISGVSTNGENYFTSFDEKDFLISVNRGYNEVLLVEFEFLDTPSDFIHKVSQGQVSVLMIAAATARLEIVKIFCNRHNIPATRGIFLKILKEALVTEERETSLNFILDFVNAASSLDVDCELDVVLMIRQVQNILTFSQKSICTEVRQKAKLEDAGVEEIVTVFKDVKKKANLWGSGRRTVVDSIDASGPEERFLPTEKIMEVVMDYAKRKVNECHLEEEKETGRSAAELAVDCLIGREIFGQHGGKAKRRSVGARDIMRSISMLQLAIDSGELQDYQKEFKDMVRSAKRSDREQQRRHRRHRRAKSANRSIGNAGKYGKTYCAMDKGVVHDRSKKKISRKREQFVESRDHDGSEAAFFGDSSSSSGEEEYSGDSDQ